MKKYLRNAMFAVLPLALACRSRPKQSEGITRQQADEILNELRQIRQLLRKAGTAAAAAGARAAHARQAEPRASRCSATRMRR